MRKKFKCKKLILENGELFYEEINPGAFRENPVKGIFTVP